MCGVILIQRPVFLLCLGLRSVRLLSLFGLGPCNGSFNHQTFFVQYGWVSVVRVRSQVAEFFDGAFFKLFELISLFLYQSDAS